MNHINIDITLKRPGFSLTIKEQFKAGITGIFGQSGAGKSTLMQCISGVVTPETGYIDIAQRKLFCKHNKINIPINKRKVGYVFQEGRLFPHYTVEKNLLYGTRFLKQRSSKSDFDGLVEMLNIQHLLFKYPSDISGGERQRVALGRALLADPKVLLLDEPFSALDQKLRQQIIPFIAKITHRLNIPVLLVSHDLPDILKLTNRLCIIKNGSVVGHDSYHELIKRKELFKILPPSDILNTITLEVKGIHPERGIITLNGFGANKKINILFEPTKKNYLMGEHVRVFLRPNDIILASSPIKNSSFQNQLKGRIEKIVEDGPRVLCLVDCGFPLMAEVSNASALQLNLQNESEIYCLFKSLALDTIHI